MVRSTTSRRAFLETIGGAGALAAGTLATLESAKGYSANDTLEVACLGTGGRCMTLMKSLAQVLAEGAAVIEAQNRNRKVVQVGMQQRSMPHIQKAHDLVKKGRIGEVFKVHLSWNRGGTSRFRRVPMGIDPGQVAWKDFLGNA